MTYMVISRKIIELLLLMMDYPVLPDDLTAWTSGGVHEKYPFEDDLPSENCTLLGTLFIFYKLKQHYLYMGSVSLPTS